MRGCEKSGMRIRALTKYAKLSPLKAMPLARKLVGLPAREALNLAAVQPSKAARLIHKTLASAIANVEKNTKRSAMDFKVDRLAIEIGPVMRRFWARSRGMARPVRKRTIHIRVELWDGNNDDKD